MAMIELVGFVRQLHRHRRPLIIIPASTAGGGAHGLHDVVVSSMWHCFGDVVGVYVCVPSLVVVVGGHQLRQTVELKKTRKEGKNEKSQRVPELESSPGVTCRGLGVESRCCLHVSILDCVIISRASESVRSECGWSGEQLIQAERYFYLIMIHTMM